jgi:hypothetical protein
MKLKSEFVKKGWLVWHPAAFFFERE